MVEKVQRKGKNHNASLFHHVFVKLDVLHQLSANNMTWENFMEKLAPTPATSPPIVHSTSSASSQPKKVGSSTGKVGV